MKRFILLLAAVAAAVPVSSQPAGTSHGDYRTTMFLVNNNRNYAFYNPARLPFLQQSDAYLQYAPLFDGTGFYHGAVNYIIGTDATASAHWSRLGVTGIPGVDDNGARQDSYNDASSSYGVSYARRLLPFLSVGGSARLVHRSFFGASGYGFGMDAGIALLPSRFRYFDNLVLDMNLQNAVAPSFDLDFGGPFGTYDVTWPRNLRTALTFTNRGGRLDLGMGINVVNFLPPGGDNAAPRRFVFDYNLTFRLARTITVVAGYNNQTVRLGWVLGYKNHSDAAIMTTINSFIGTRTQYAFTRRFGNTRDDNYLIFLARGREGAADEILADALSLFDAGLFLEALFRFKELTFLFPGHTGIDRFLYLQGICYDRLGLPEGALASFGQVVREHPQSPFVPQALMKSVRLYGDAGDIGEQSAAYQQLATRFPATPYRDAAALYLGRALRSTGNDSAAFDFFAAVPGSSAYFQAAAYHAAVTLLELGRPDDAAAEFSKAAADTLSNPVIDMRSRSLAALGHLALGRAAYDTALAWYARVPRPSPVSASVRLGTAHALFGQRALTAAIDSFRVLAASAGPGEPVFHEASFMAAHCRYLAGDYRGALDGFNAYITAAMSDSAAALSDTGGTGTLRDSLAGIISGLQGEIDQFGAGIRKQAFYRPPSPKETAAFIALGDSLRRVTGKKVLLKRRTALLDAKAEWLASAHEMAGKASRALIELRYRAIYDTYDRPIAELEKRLYELLPPEPEQPAADENGTDPDIEIMDDGTE